MRDRLGDGVLTGLDYFGARHFHAGQGRFASPDPALKIEKRVLDPQHWNLYGYVRNNPLVFVDPNGEWPFWIHDRILTHTVGGLLNPIDRKILKRMNRDMDFGEGQQDAGRSPTHSMCAPRVGGIECATQINEFVNGRLAAANRESNGGEMLNTQALGAFAEAAHTLGDMGSPMHVGRDGAIVWDPAAIGMSGQAAHVYGERSENVSWLRIGDSVRLVLAGFYRAFPKLVAGKKFETMERQAIEGIVRERFSGRRNSDREEAAAMQCAMGNPAACIQ
jgi:RHS repeat-associated protein